MCGRASKFSYPKNAATLLHPPSPRLRSLSPQGCAIAHYPDPAKYVPFIYCFEGVHQSDLSALGKCASSAGMDASAIKTCASGSEGKQVEAENARLTVALGPSKLGTPWIMVNGQHLEDPDAMLSAVCTAYTGTKPAGCSNVAAAAAAAAATELA